MSGEGTFRIPVVRVRLVRERTVTCRPQVAGANVAATIAVRLLASWDRECFLSIHLDAMNGLLGVETVAAGTLDSVLVHPREVWKGALLANSAALVVAHCHPSGDATPSYADLRTTRQLIDAGDLLGIPLQDHLIVAGNNWSSMRETTHLWNHRHTTDIEGVGWAGK